MISPKVTLPSAADQVRAYAMVLERDEERCQRCRRGVVVHRDHRKNRSQGGLTVLSNVHLLCPECHLWRTDHPVEAARDGGGVPAGPTRSSPPPAGGSAPSSARSGRRGCSTTTTPAGARSAPTRREDERKEGRTDVVLPRGRPGGVPSEVRGGRQRVDRALDSRRIVVQGERVGRSRSARGWHTARDEARGSESSSRSAWGVAEDGAFQFRDWEHQDFPGLPTRTDTAPAAARPVKRGPHGRAANTPSRRRGRGTLLDVEPEQPAGDTRTLETRRPPTQRGRQHGVCAAAKDAHTRVSDSSPEAHPRPRRTHQAKTLAGSRADYPRSHDGIGACKTPVPDTMLRDYRRRSVTCVSSSSSKRHVIRSASAEPPIVRNT